MPGKTSCKAKIDVKVLDNFKKDFKTLSGKKLSKMQECVLTDTLDLSQGSMQKLSEFFPNQKINNKKDLKYLEIKDKIVNYLETEKLSKNENPKKTSEKLINYSFVFNDDFYSCSLTIKDNKIKFFKKINNETYSKLISQSGRYNVI